MALTLDAASGHVGRSRPGAWRLGGHGGMQAAGVLGCLGGTGSDGCGNSAVLSDDDFTYDGVDDSRNTPPAAP